MSTRADIVIVGGGVWGASAAYHLSLSSKAKKIVLLERNSTIADETTKQAAGQIGQLRSDPLMIGAVRYTLELLNRFQAETGLDPQFVSTGSLHLAQNEQRMQAFLDQLPTAQQLGINVEVATPDLIRRIAPAIDLDRVTGAIFVPSDGYVNAHAWATALASAAINGGVQVHLKTIVESIEIDNAQVRRVKTSNGVIETERVIVASGPWTKKIADNLAISLPTVPIRLQQTRTVADSAQPAQHPVVRIPDQSCYLRPENGGYLYGFFDPHPLAYSEPLQNTSDLDADETLYRESTQRLAPTFPILGQLNVSQHRQGMVTCTPDANYVIGPVPEANGICFATGCGAMGIAGSGGVGRWLARWAIDDNPGEDLTTLSPCRFGDQWRNEQSLTDKCRDVFSNYYALRSATYRLAE